MAVFNLSYRKVGGLHFIKVGRITLMFCLSRRYKSLHAVSRQRTKQGNPAPLLLTYSGE